MTTAVALTKIFRKIFIFLCLTSLSLSAKEEDSKSLYSLFTPPPKWEIVAPSISTSLVKVTFSKKSSSPFPPSLNLTEEALKEGVDMQEYLKAVQNLHTSNKHRWRKLGSFHTKAGAAQLTEIDLETEIGPLRILQLIFLHHQTAYLITAAATKEEFSSYQKEFLESFRSFHLTKNLTDSIENLEKQESLKKKIENLIQSISEKGIEDPIFQKKKWPSFQKFLAKEFQKEGTYWQLLVLATTHQELSQKLK